MAEYTSEDYVRANKINARLASRYDAQLVSEGKALAAKLLEYVKSKVENYDEFVRKVNQSEEFSLHESKQLGKAEKPLKPIYLRAAGLLETIAEAEQRRGA